MQYALLIHSTPESRHELRPAPDGAHEEWVAFSGATKAVAPRAGKATE